MKKKYLQEVTSSESYLSDVPIELLDRFVSNLNSFIFDYRTSLSSSQIMALFKSLREGNFKIKKLDFENLDLSGVKPEILSSAINNLEEINCFHCPKKHSFFREIDQFGDYLTGHSSLWLMRRV